MKRVTFIFKDHCITVKDPKELDLCISMMLCSEIREIEVTDDDDRNHYFKVTEAHELAN